jgi:hypothetical protein
MLTFGPKHSAIFVLIVVSINPCVTLGKDHTVRKRALIQAAAWD